MDKPKTVIKKPALYKMVSFKGVDDSASKETKEIQTGLFQLIHGFPILQIIFIKENMDYWNIKIF